MRVISETFSWKQCEWMSRSLSLSSYNIFLRSVRCTLKHNKNEILSTCLADCQIRPDKIRFSTWADLIALPSYKHQHTHQFSNTSESSDNSNICFEADCIKPQKRTSPTLHAYGWSNQRWRAVAVSVFMAWHLPVCCAFLFLSCLDKCVQTERTAFMTDVAFLPYLIVPACWRMIHRVHSHALHCTVLILHNVSHCFHWYRVKSTVVKGILHFFLGGE